MSLQAAVIPSFSQAGDMPERLRTHDWAGSELGPRAAWPHSLNLALNICMDSDFPIAVWWGPRLIQFYNDAYQPILGTEKDRTAFGHAAIDSWGEIWDTIGPMVDQVMQRGEAVKGEDLPLYIHRDGELGLSHFTFSYSPIRDERGAIVGMFTAAVETTARVALEGRQAFRLKLAEDLRQAVEPEDAMRMAGAALRGYLDASWVAFAAVDATRERLLLEDSDQEMLLEGLAPGALACLDAGQPLRIEHAQDLGHDVAALLVLPVLRDGKAGAALLLGRAAPCRWTDAAVLSATEALDQIEGTLSRLRAEQVARRQLGSEIERLRRLFDQAPSFIAVTRGPEHVYELANRAYLSAAGNRDILDKPVRSALPELDGQGYYELLDQVYATGKPFLTKGMPVKLQRTPGTELEELIVDFIYQPVTGPDGAISGILIEGNDVTQQYRAQAELQRERDLSQHVLSSMKEVFAIVDSDWRLRQVNDEGLLFARRSRDDLIGKDHWSVWPGLRGTEVETMFHRVRNTGNAEIREFLWQLPGGQDVWMEIRAYPSLENGLAYFFRDITERKTAQQQLRDADRRKDEFLAMLAHELRNPLAPVSAAADLLGMAQLDEARLRQTSGIISRQVRHMTSLIDDLMDVSRVTRGLVTLEQEVLDTRRIVADAVEQTRPLIAARRHTLDLQLAPDSAFVRGDQKRLVQVLANLLNNAAKYTPDGGAITLGMQVRPAVVQFSVKDNGIGMAPALMRDVFELFMQAERSSDRAQGGLGIGLALVRSLVELHKGTVSVRSAGIGMGSEFTVAIPRVLLEAGMLEAPPRPARAGAARRLRIVVVDDNVDAAQMLAMFLETAGHRVAIEHSAHTALERTRGEAIDVFLLDIGLPGMDGYELAQRLRQQAVGTVPTFIAVTGYGQEADRNFSMNAGFSYHFVKPVDTEKLTALLATLADSAQPSRG